MNTLLFTSTRIMELMVLITVMLIGMEMSGVQDQTKVPDIIYVAEGTLGMNNEEV